MNAFEENLIKTLSQIQKEDNYNENENKDDTQNTNNLIELRNILKKKQQIINKDSLLPHELEHKVGFYRQQVADLKNELELTNMKLQMKQTLKVSKNCNFQFICIKKKLNEFTFQNPLNYEIPLDTEVEKD